MSAIRTNAAAAMLGVSPNTLRSWERRFGFPEPRRTAGGHRQFDLVEIEALRVAFEETHNVSSAVALARERGTGPASASRLRSALARFDEEEADRIVEEGLAVRSLERTVEEVMLGAIATLHEDGDGSSAEYGFAWRWATGWLAAAQRSAPSATREESVLLFDATATLELDALHAQALELFLRRAGLRTLTLGVTLDAQRVAPALNALRPSAVVLTGARASLDALGRIVYSARRIGGADVAVLDYRGPIASASASTVARLGDEPLAARDHLLAALADRGVDEPRTVRAPRPLHALAG